MSNKESRLKEVNTEIYIRFKQIENLHHAKEYCSQLNPMCGGGTGGGVNQETEILELLKLLKEYNENYGEVFES